MKISRNAKIAGLGFISGALAGGVVSYILAYKKYANAVKNASKEVTEKVTETTKVYLDYTPNNVIEALDKANRSTEELIKQYEDKAREYAEAMEEAADTLNAKLVKPVDLVPEEELAELEHPSDDEDEYEEEDPDDTFIFDIDESQDDGSAGQYARFIKEESFGDVEGNDLVYLYFYFNDKTLVSEEEEIIVDPYSLIGDALTKYGFQDSSEPVIYIRNPKISTDFKVIKLFASYSDSL